MGRWGSNDLRAAQNVASCCRCGQARANGQGSQRETEAPSAFAACLSSQPVLLSCKHLSLRPPFSLHHTGHEWASAGSFAAGPYSDPQARGGFPRSVAPIPTRCLGRAVWEPHVALDVSLPLGARSTRQQRDDPLDQILLRHKESRPKAEMAPAAQAKARCFPQIRAFAAPCATARQAPLDGLVSAWSRSNQRAKVAGMDHCGLIQHLLMRLCLIIGNVLSQWNESSLRYSPWVRLP